MIFDSNASAYLAGGGAPHTELGVRIDAKNRSTQTLERVQLWTGTEDVTLTVFGGPRTYLASHGMMGVDEFDSEAGLDIRVSRLAMALSEDVVEQLVLGYDPERAPCEIHVLIFNAKTMEYVGAALAVKGMVVKTPIREQARGVAQVTLEIESVARHGTRLLPTMKSDQSQKLRSGDRGRRYADVTGVDVPWGQDRGDNYWISKERMARVRRA